jgi:hypothetical protein
MRTIDFPRIKLHERGAFLEKIPHNHTSVTLFAPPCKSCSSKRSFEIWPNVFTLFFEIKQENIVFLAFENHNILDKHASFQA